MPAPYRRLGRVLKTHGTQGEVTVAPRDDLSFERLEDDPVWVVPPLASGAIERRIRVTGSASKGVIVQISGVDDLSGAHELVGRWLLGAGEELDETEGVERLLGYGVRDARRGDIGTVSEVIETGANDVLVVEDGPFGQVLIPVIDQVMQRVDDQARVVHVVLLDGLIEEDQA